MYFSLSDCINLVSSDRSIHLQKEMFQADVYDLNERHPFSVDLRLKLPPVSKHALHVHAKY